jgi:hypothetical protein
LCLCRKIFYINLLFYSNFSGAKFIFISALLLIKINWLNFISNYWTWSVVLLWICVYNNRIWRQYFIYQ